MRAVLWGLPPTSAWGDASNPLIFLGFGAGGPKKRVGRGVQPRPATFLRPPKRASRRREPRACFNRIGAMNGVRQRWQKSLSINT